MDAVMAAMQIMNGLNMGLAQADVSSAYLHAPAKTIRYARPLPGMEDPTHKHKFIRLIKAIYGDPEAGNAYFGFHIETHLDYGFTNVTRDGTILMYRAKKVVNGREESSMLILITIVDDSILGYQDKEVAEKYFEYLQTKAKFVVSWTPKQFVGIEIDYDREKGILRLRQTDYINKALQKLGINKEDPTVTSPWLENADLGLADGEPDEVMVTKARTCIGVASWVANGTRKDLTAVVRTAARVMHKPKTGLIQFLMHLLQWIFNTRNRCLTFRRGEWKTLHGVTIANLQLAAYVDSSWANAGPEFQMRSQYGWCIMMGGACVAAGSGLGSFTVDSSSYAEVYALHKASKDIEYIQMIVNVIMEGNLPPKAIVFEDNTTAIAVMTNNKSATRSRHFDIKLFYMAGLIQRKVLDIAYVPTEHQVADMLTKDTPEHIFKRLSAALMGVIA
jgi:hypothetical protein